MAGMWDGLGRTHADALRELLVLSIGFWTPFMYAHWFIAATAGVGGVSVVVNYPGVAALSLGVLWVAVVIAKHLAPDLSLFARDGSYSPVVLSFAAAVACAAVPALSIIGAIPAMVAGSLAILVLHAFWWEEYARIEIFEYTLSLCVGIIVLGLLKVVMALIGESFALLAFFMPLICAVGLKLRPCRSASTGDSWFTLQVFGSLKRLGMGVVVFLSVWSLFNAVLKTASGHQGFGVTASVMLTILIQVIDMGFAVIVFWWVAVRKGQVDYVQLWKVSFVCLCAAIVFMAFAGPIQAVQVFSTSAFVMAQMLVDLACGNIARHGQLPAFYVFGAGGLAYNVTDWFARAFVGSFGIVSFSYEVLVLLLFCAVIALAFFLPSRTMGSQYLLSDLNGHAPCPDERDYIEQRCKKLALKYGLSNRELEIVGFLCQGRSKPYIAEALYLSENTVGTYTRRLYKKLGVHGKQELLDLVFDGSQDN